MFVDSQNLTEKISTADVAIVGSGPAGIVIADQLSRAGLDVCLIESGGQEISAATQALNVAGVKGLRSFSAAVSRFRCFGGSTARWGGQCRPLDAIDFQPDQRQSNHRWPFDLSHMTPYFRRAVEICNLPTNYDDTEWCVANQNSCLDTLTYAFSHPRDFGEIYRNRFRTCEKLRVLLNTTVTHIQLNSAGNRASYVSARSSNGRQIRVSADAIVVAGGGIENARLLLASNDVAKTGIGNENDLVGRYFHDHPYAFIGELRSSDADPVVNQYTIQDFDGVGINQKSHMALALNDAVVASEGLNKCALYFVRRPHYKATADYFSRGGISLNYIVDLLRRRESLDRPLMPELIRSVTGLRSILATSARFSRHLFRPSHTFAARVVVNTEPNADSRVTLGDRRDRFGVNLPIVNWQLHDSDKQGLKRLMSAAKEYFFQNRLGELIEIPWDEKTGWPRGMTGGKHHMGTTRMHKDPNLGVVDADSRVHGVDNLYLAGSSVFPTGGYANPTLTIVALAVRLADFLEQT